VAVLEAVALADKVMIGSEENVKTVVESVSIAASLSVIVYEPLVPDVEETRVPVKIPAPDTRTFVTIPEMVVAEVVIDVLPAVILHVMIRI